MNVILKKSKLITRTPPKNFSNNMQNLLKRDLTFMLPNVMLNVLTKSYINSDGFIWKNMNFHKESYRNRLRKKPSKTNRIKFFLKVKLSRAKKVSEGLWVLDSWSNNYFHWTGDVLYKLFLVKDLKPKIKLIIPADFLKISFVKETINFLKLDIYIIPNDLVLKVNKLFLINEFYFGDKGAKNYLAQTSGNWHADPILKLKSAFSYKVENPQKNIYITRKNAKFRKIENEIKLIELLKKWEFEILDFDKITWLHQRNICLNSKLILTINGAALTNMIFLSKGSKVIEIRHPLGNEQNCFFSLASLLSIDYYLFLGEPRINDVNKSNLKVNLEQLDTLLSKI